MPCHDHLDPKLLLSSSVATAAALVLEHNRPASGCDEHAVTQVPAHSTCQHEALQVPPLAHHVLHTVAVGDAGDILQAQPTTHRHTLFMPVL